MHERAPIALLVAPCVASLLRGFHCRPVPFVWQQAKAALQPVWRSLERFLKHPRGGRGRGRAGSRSKSLQTGWSVAVHLLL
eukprot:8351208-Alexandrium_andersonii.AAC.1